VGKEVSHMKMKSIVFLFVAVLVMGTLAPGWADHTMPDIVKGSKIIGKSVQDMEGTKLGEIEDLAINEIGGEVRYVVLPFRGILGMSEKYYAIPWEALTLSNDRKHFVVGVKENTLKQAPRFDKEKWPDFADPAYYVTVYEFYHVPIPAGAVAGETKLKKETDKKTRDRAKGN
jgi:sporulation protein YlmC with PRC-barrel domain